MSKTALAYKMYLVIKVKRSVSKNVSLLAGPLSPSHSLPFTLSLSLCSALFLRDMLHYIR